ncbi:hypothetical protein ACKVMT_09875 [Halobacteriales archaeon Cl-PHB]
MFRRTVLRAVGLAGVAGLAGPVAAISSSGGSRVDSGGRDALYGATRTPDGGVLAVGTRQSRTIDEPTATGAIPEGYALALGPDGETSWEATYASPLGSPAEGQADWLWTSIPRFDSGALLVGVGYNAGPDAATGWVRAVDDQGDPDWRWSAGDADTGNSFNDTLAGATRTADGYLLAGRTGGGSAFDDDASEGWLVALSADGGLRWHESYAAGDRGHDELRAVLPRSDGALLVGEGVPGEAGGATAGWLVGVDAAGTVEFQRNYRPRAGKNALVDGVRTKDGGYLLVGTSYGGDSWGRRHDEPLPRGQGWLLAVDAEGRQRWSRLLDATSQLFAVVSARESGYVVAGASDGAGWVARVDGAGDRQASYRSPTAVAYGGLVPLDEDASLAVGWTPPTAATGGDAVTTRLLMGASRFAVRTTADAPRISYEFSATGPVTRVTDAGRDAAEANDEMASQPSTTTVSGVVGSGYGDTFDVAGEVVAFRTDASPAHLTLVYDGDDVTTDLLGDGQARLFEVVAGPEAPRFAYEFAVTGPVERVTGAGRNAAEATNDTLTRQAETTSVAGVTGSGYGDAYRVYGEIAAFTASVDAARYTLRLDGEPVTL